MQTFTESQRFRQWWLWAIIGASLLMSINRLLMDAGAWPVLFVVLVLPVFMWFYRLDTRFDQEGVHYRVFPLFSWRTIRWADITRATVTTYGFVGYGIRWNFGEWVYNVSGNQGLRIETSNGKRILIGTRKPNEVRAFLAENTAFVST